MYNSETIAQLRIKHNFLKTLFLSSTIQELSKLDPKTKNSESISIFKNNILKVIFAVFLNPIILKEVCLGLDCLCEHRLKLNLKIALILFALAYMKLKQLLTT